VRFRLDITGKRVMRGAILIGAALLATACTHKPFESSSLHYATFKVPQPKGSTVHVCHSYGCRTQTRVRFKPDEIAKIKAEMDKYRGKGTAADERRAVAYAIGWLERYVGKRIGTATDRAGMDFVGSGDKTQQDCVDEATNTTSYLTLLQNNGLLKHHTVGAPFAKENYLRGIAGWTHWTAVLKENETGQKWAVDSWIYKNGENPAVVKAEDWYISDLESLPGSMT
jgi:hypothetical protein